MASNKADAVAPSPMTEDCSACKGCWSSRPTDCLSVRVYLRGGHTRFMGLEYTANAHVPWVHPAERITSWCSRLDGRFSSTTRLSSIASRFSRRNRPYGCHAGLDAVVLNLDARGVFLLGWVRMPSARDASL